MKKEEGDEGAGQQCETQRLRWAFAFFPPSLPLLLLSWLHQCVRLVVVVVVVLWGRRRRRPYFLLAVFHHYVSPRPRPRPPEQVVYDDRHKKKKKKKKKQRCGRRQRQRQYSIVPFSEGPSQLEIKTKTTSSRQCAAAAAAANNKTTAIVLSWPHTCLLASSQHQQHQGTKVELSGQEKEEKE